MEASVQKNPWASNDTLLGLNLGDPKSGLVVARRCGLLPAGRQASHLCLKCCNYFYVNYDSLSTTTRCSCQQAAHSHLQDRVTHSSSVQMIKVLQEITELNRELLEIEFELHRQSLDMDSADLVHLDVLEQRLLGINTVLSHFTDVLNSKDHVLTQLQSCSTESSLQVEVSFHKHLLDTLQCINPTLTNLSSNNSRIKWAQKFDLFHSPVEEKMTTAVQSLVDCKDMYQNCQTLHNQHHSD